LLQGLPQELQLPAHSAAAPADDEVRLERGVDETGLLYALLVGTFKIGQAVSIGIVYAALDLVGFDVKAGPANGAGALLGVSLIYAAVPSLMAVGAALLMVGYPLTAARYAEIQAQLADRRDPEPRQTVAGREILTAPAG